MGRLLIKQRVFSWTDTYDVYDGYGNPIYFVKADLFSIGHRIRIFNKQTGEELGVIQQRIISFLPRFELFANGRSYGMIQQRFSLFRPKFDIECNGWHVEGDFWQWDYDVYAGSYVVAHIRKELFRWGDTYVIDVANPNDEFMALTLAIAIDAAKCSQNDDGRNTLY